MSDEQVDATVVVTGGTGYLAGWVIAGLLERGYRVQTTVRDVSKAEGLRAMIAPQVGVARAASLEVFQADLLDDEGWDAAFAGADCVIHTASPMPFDTSADLIGVAREGTRRVLMAAAQAGVRRVVLTSSGVTAVPDHPDMTATEAVRSVPSGEPSQVYPDSKILAEQDAWDIAASTSLELTAVLPTFMQGPPVGGAGHPGTIDVIRRLVTGKLPALPRIGWNVVDVRDVAELHILAMESPAAAGERFLGSGTFLWYSDIARIIREGIPELASTVPTRRMPDVVVKLVGRFNPQMAMLRRELGRRRLVDSSKARDLLGWQTRAADVTILDTAGAVRSSREQTATVRQTAG